MKARGGLEIPPTLCTPQPDSLQTTVQHLLVRAHRPSSSWNPKWISSAPLSLSNLVSSILLSSENQNHHWHVTIPIPSTDGQSNTTKDASITRVHKQEAAAQESRAAPHARPSIYPKAEASVVLRTGRQHVEPGRQKENGRPQTLQPLCPVCGQLLNFCIWTSWI